MTWLLPSALSRSAPASACSTKDSEPASGTSASELAFWLTLSGKPTQRPASWRGWRKRPWSQRLFGAAISPTPSSAVLWGSTQLSPVSPVSRSASPARAKSKKTSGGSGPASLNSLATFDPLSSSWKTFQALFPPEASPTFSAAWPASGSMRSGVVSPRERPALRTNANASSSWPSTRSEDAESCGNHLGKTDSLSGAVGSWSTSHDQASGPDAWQTPATDSFRSRGGERKDEMGLDQDDRTWMTPTSGEAKGRAYQRDGGDKNGTPRDALTGQSQKWSTPTARDMNGANPPETIARKKAQGHGARMLNDDAVNWPTVTARDGDTRRMPTKPGTAAWDNKIARGAVNAAGMPSDDLSSAASAWPTPTDMMTGDRGSPETFEARRARMKERHQGRTGNGCGIDLGMAAKTWPTPNTMPEAPNNSKNRGNGEIRERTTPQGLGDVATRWPTPAARDFKGENSDGHLEAGTGRKHLDQLPNFIAHVFSHPDPQAASGQTLFEIVHTSRRRLNPAFVCWLMGWPWFWMRAEPINSAAQATASWRCALAARLSSLLDG